MNPPEAFLRDIRRRPHDDAPRLIFADWLEERDDPRGEFIRLQCLRAGFSIGDARKLPLLKREQALLQRHRDRWVGPLSRWGVGWEFRRGLLHLRVDAPTFLRTDWAELSRTETWEWVETTAIRVRRQEEFRAVASSSLAGIGAPDLRDAEIQAVAGSPSLAHIEALDLRDNALADEGTAILANTAHLSHLRSLDLTFNQIGPAGASELALSLSLKGLTALNLDDNRLGDGGVSQLLSTIVPVPIERLHLRWNAVGPDGARALAAAGNLSHLTTLHLGYNEVGDAGAAALASATGLKQLTDLHLEHNGVGAAAAAALRRRFGDGVHL